MKSRSFLNSIVLVDKPSGKTSNETLNILKKLFQIKKVGHAGTLDKFASGLLVVCTGMATKLTRYFLEDDKCYSGAVRLGVATETDDLEGEPLERRPFDHITEKDIMEAVKRFTGSIEQLPPRYSALKISGRRASDLAREGMDVELKKRRVVIHSLSVKEIDIKLGRLLIDVRCSKGTYIRSLARDIGESLGTRAYLEELRRTGSGRFSLDNAVTVDELSRYIDGDDPGKDFLLRPVDALSGFGVIRVEDDAKVRVMNGAPFNRDQALSVNEGEEKTFIITDKEENVIAIADIEIDKWHIVYKNTFHYV